MRAFHLFGFPLEDGKEEDKTFIKLSARWFSMSVDCE